MIERIEELRRYITQPEQAERQAGRDAVGALARPRMAGTEEALEVGADLRKRFEDMGYEVTEMPFSFSSAPGRWGVPVLGLLNVIGLLLAALFVRAGQPLGALIALAAALLLAVLLAALAPWMINSLPFARVETANWLVHRPGARPRLLVMAHRDTKSQMVPILLRSGGAIGAVAAWVIMAFVTVLALTTDIELAGTAIGVAVVGVLATLPLLLSWSSNGSPGALDNATGLAVLLGMAQRSSDDDEVAFLVTDGEEMGLAGARHAASRLPRVEGIVNVDGIDDDGPFLIMERHGYPPRGSAPHLATALFTSAALLDLPAARRNLPVGVHVDHIPFVDAGLPALTLMRGSRSSLMRVHLGSDDHGSTRGEGVADAVALIQGALRIRRTPHALSATELPEGLRPR